MSTFLRLVVTFVVAAALTVYAADSDSRQLKPAFKFSEVFRRDTPSCTCNSKMRPCIFVHGMGSKEEMADNQDEYSSYWGNVTGHTPCCSSIKYTHLNTVNVSWTRPSQQQKVCDRILAVNDESQGSTVKDTIIITHSMGGPMLAGAIANGHCQLDKSSTWISLGAPMRGSMASDEVQESCEGDTDFVLEKVANITGRCPASTSLRSLAYEGERHSTKKLNDYYEAAQRAYTKHVYAAACSNGFSGLVSHYQWQFWLLGKTIPHKSSENDGMVEFLSCRADIPKDKFGNTYRDRFYVTKLNHYDLQFRAGDSLRDEAKMPLKWLECLL